MNYKVKISDLQSADGQPDSLLFPTNVEQLLSFRLSTLSHKISLGGGKIYKSRFDLNSRELRIFMTLGAFGSMTSIEIAASANLDKSVISRGSRNLLQRELIEATSSNTDLRKSMLSLTEAGRVLYVEVFELAKRRMSIVMATLSSEERYVLDGVLAKLNVHLDELNTKGYPTLNHDQA